MEYLPFLILIIWYVAAINVPTTSMTEIEIPTLQNVFELQKLVEWRFCLGKLKGTFSFPTSFPN